MGLKASVFLDQGHRRVGKSSVGAKPAVTGPEEGEAGGKRNSASKCLDVLGSLPRAKTGQQVRSRRGARAGRPGRAGQGGQARAGIRRREMDGTQERPLRSGPGVVGKREVEEKGKQNSKRENKTNKRKKSEMSVHMGVCVHVCACVCMCARVCVCARAKMKSWLGVVSLQDSYHGHRGVESVQQQGKLELSPGWVYCWPAHHPSGSSHC